MLPGLTETSDQPCMDVVGTELTSSRKSGDDAADSSRAPDRSDDVVTPPPIAKDHERDTSRSDSVADVAVFCTVAMSAGASAETGPAVSSVPATSARTAPAAAGTRDTTSGRATATSEREAA